MPANKRNIVEYDRLNLLGQAVYVAGGIARVGARVLDKTLERAVDIAVRTERAFREGRDNTLEDAKIVDEQDR